MSNLAVVISLKVDTWVEVGLETKLLETFFTK